MISFIEIIEVIENSRNIDAKAWMIKYFMADSVDDCVFNIIRGINDRRLISSPIHILNHE